MDKMNNGILDVVHETAKGLYNAGIIDANAMHEFEALCLPPVILYTPEEIRELRMRLLLSRADFAAYLNVSKTSVAGWESGGKRPCSAAVKLLNLVDRKGLEAVS